MIFLKGSKKNQLIIEVNEIEKCLTKLETGERGLKLMLSKLKSDFRFLEHENAAEKSDIYILKREDPLLMTKEELKWRAKLVVDKFQCLENSFGQTNERYLWNTKQISEELINIKEDKDLYSKRLQLKQQELAEIIEKIK